MLYTSPTPSKKEISFTQKAFSKLLGRIEDAVCDVEEIESMTYEAYKHVSREEKEQAHNAAWDANNLVLKVINDLDELCKELEEMKMKIEQSETTDVTQKDLSEEDLSEEEALEMKLREDL